jgi:hypothetical protein
LEGEFVGAEAGAGAEEFREVEFAAMEEGDELLVLVREFAFGEEDAGFRAEEFVAALDFDDGDELAGMEAEEDGGVFLAVLDEFFGAEDVALELGEFGAEELFERRR